MADKTLEEKLAELEHAQWIEWSQNLVAREVISPERVERWRGLWKPYAELTEAEKDQDRVWAKKSIQAIRDAGYVQLADDQTPPENPFPLLSGEKVIENGKTIYRDYKNPEHETYEYSQSDMLRAGFKKVKPC